MECSNVLKRDAKYGIHLLPSINKKHIEGNHRSMTIKGTGSAQVTRY